MQFIANADLVFCTVSVYDLLVESKLTNKLNVMIMILLVPIVGIALFEKRKKADESLPSAGPEPDA